MKGNEDDDQLFIPFHQSVAVYIIGNESMRHIHSLVFPITEKRKTLLFFWPKISAMVIVAQLQKEQK